MPPSKHSKRTGKCVAAMMVRNEADQIRETTLKSIKDYIGWCIIYDTGSTDKTIDVIREYCAQNDMRCDVLEGKFVNFAVSRNRLMDYCDELLVGKTDTWILQLDAHDELQNGDKLVDFVENFKGPHTGAYITQKWWAGQNLDTYYNVRLIRPHYEWRYHPDSVVHEYQLPRAISEGKQSSNDVILRTEGIILYQDRTTQGDSSFKRFVRDKEMLYAKHLEKPKEPRTLFYLAQTAACLGQNDEAYKYYLLRIKELGFWEEVYHALFRLGELSQLLNHDWEESMMWYTKAFQHSQRAEPLVRIAEHYREYNMQGQKEPEWHTCYMYANMACQLMFPHTHILFIDQHCYTYKRWHLLGIAGFYAGRYKEGKEACLKAIESQNLPLDRNNLKFYLEKELELLAKGTVECPKLIAMSIGEQEIRHKNELDIKHDRKKAIDETIDEIITSRKQQGQILNEHIIATWRAVLGSTKQVPVIPVPEPSQTTQNVLPPNMGKLNRRDRRARLRQMLNDRKK